MAVRTHEARGQKTFLDLGKSEKEIFRKKNTSGNRRKNKFQSEIDRILICEYKFSEEQNLNQAQYIVLHKLQFLQTKLRDE